MNQSENKDNGTNYTKGLNLTFLLLIFLVILFIPALLTSFYWKFDFTNTGQIGDTIGGITAPFIGFLSAYLVFKAFQAQIKANEFQLKIINSQRREFQLNLFLKITEDFKAFQEELKYANIYSFRNPEVTLNEIKEILVDPEDPIDVQQELMKLCNYFKLILKLIEGSELENEEKSFTLAKLYYEFNNLLESLGKISQVLKDENKMNCSAINQTIQEIIEKFGKLKSNFEFETGTLC